MLCLFAAFTPMSPLLLVDPMKFHVLSRFRLLLLPLFLVCMLCETSSATVVTLTDRPTWLSGLTAVPTTDSFAGLSTGNQNSPFARPGYTLTTSAGSFRIANNTNGTLSPAPYVVVNNSGTIVTITLSTPQSAIGLVAYSVASSGVLSTRTNVASNVTVTVDGVPLVRSTNGPTFFGFHSTSPFTTVTLSANAGSLAFDTIEFGKFTGEITPVPEPGTMILGAVAVVVSLRYRRQRQMARTTCS